MWSNEYSVALDEPLRPSVFSASGWAAPNRDTATLRRSFDALGVERAAQITHVSADAADWIADVVAERCPAAIRCADPFHVEFAPAATVYAVFARWARSGAWQRIARPTVTGRRVHVDGVALHPLPIFMGARR